MVINLYYFCKCVQKRCKKSLLKISQFYSNIHNTQVYPVSTSKNKMSFLFMKKVIKQEENQIILDFLDKNSCLK